MAFAPKGAYNRAPIFNGDHFDYWKSSMRIHINSFDGEVWNAIENGPFVPTITDAHGIVTNKPMAQWALSQISLWHNGRKRKRKRSITMQRHKIF
ncbi:hypothetical protein P8452_60992 [Trifolium repens]|nr:hypothetical protein P8452_60992 [Trifolium repens]